jgi:hypothetical protein
VLLTNNNGRELRPLLLSLLVELVQDPDANNDEPKNEKNLSDGHVCLLDGRVDSVGGGDFRRVKVRAKPLRP